MLQDLLQSMRVVALPTKTNFRGVSVREVALFKGEFGWGEFSPFLEYDADECAPWLQSAIAAATKPVPKLFREKVKVNGTIPALNNSVEIEKIVQSFDGVDTFKIKVGDNLAEDIARLAKVRSLKPKAKLRIDVNGSWSVETAITNLRAIYENIGELEYVEQPCATTDELKRLKDEVRIPLKIAGDEILRKATDPFKVDLVGAVDILVLKMQPLGGIDQAKELANHHGLPVVVSSALESAVGINYGLQLAGSIANLEFDCGLGTGALLAADIAELPIINGEIAITKVEPDFSGLEVSPDRYEWWKNRVLETAEKIK
jgi:O-succinylbenzoate synthase